MVRVCPRRTSRRADEPDSALSAQRARPRRQGGQRQTALAAIKTAFSQETDEATVAQWRIVDDQLHVKLPKLGPLMDEAETEVLSHFAFPKARCAQIHSTNPLERLNAAVKRCTDVVGSFPNDAAVTRLVGLILLEQHNEWAPQRRYMLIRSSDKATSSELE